MNVQRDGWNLYSLKLPKTGKKKLFFSYGGDITGAQSFKNTKAHLFMMEYFIILYYHLGVLFKDYEGDRK